jgi:hypothetical protein
MHHGMSPSKILESQSYKYSFPHVSQLLYPSVRLDNILGQYYHFTQIPKHVVIDPDTGLSPTYQIVICFDSNYHDLSKKDAQDAPAARLEMMRIPMSSRFREPISTIIDKNTSKWLGFLRADLFNPQIDGLALL